VTVAIAVAVLLAVLAQPASAQPTEADVFVAEGILALEDKKYEEALQHLRRALEREPGHVEALYYSGVALIALGRSAEAVPLLEQARQTSPDEASINFQLGLAYFALEDYVRAQPLLEDVFARDPGLDALGYYVGYLRYRRGDNQGALRAFRAGRTTDPNIAQLTRFYAGLALNALGLPAQAAAEVEHALRLQPASPLTGPAERLRETFTQARSRERRWHLDARLGFYYDDNAPAQPDARQDDATVALLRDGRSQTFGESFSARVEYDWWKSGPWLGTAGYSFFMTYNNDLTELNVVDHLATLNVSYQALVANMPLQTGFQYAFEYLMLDEEPLLQRNAFSLFATLVEGPGHLTNATFKVELKEYRESGPVDSKEIQDGNNYMIGLLHLFRFREDRHFIKLGYQLDVEDTQGANLSYLGHRFLTGAQYTLPWFGIRLIYDFYLHYRQYDHKHTLFPDEDPDTRRRRDSEFSNVFRIEVPLPQNLTLGLDYQGTIQDSSLAPFSYHRNIYTVWMSWTY
jgi:tetratricopeptide (TPR) repeat protein